MIQSNIIKAILICSIGLLGYSARIDAQAIHFSQFDKAGFIINPAKAGSFYGTARVGGIYRDQNRKISSHPFTTTQLYVDSPISFVGKNKRSWIGVGGMMYVDRVGLAALSTNSYNASAAYHYSLDAAYANVISVAGSFGYVQKSNDLGSGKLFFEDEVSPNGSIGGQSSQDRNTYAKNVSYMDISAGLLYKSRLSESMKLAIGTGIAHLNRPSVEFGTTATKMPIRINAHASLEKRFDDKLRVMPRIFFARMGQAQQIQAQAIAGYKINPSFELKGGLGTRIGDAVQVMLGAEFSTFDVGISYDYTISDIANANTGGALELALSYIFIKEKKVSSKPKLICPQL